MSTDPTPGSLPEPVHESDRDCLLQLPDISLFPEARKEGDFQDCSCGRLWVIGRDAAGQLVWHNAGPGNLKALRDLAPGDRVRHPGDPRLVFTVRQVVPYPHNRNRLNVTYVESTDLSWTHDPAYTVEVL